MHLQHQRTLSACSATATAAAQRTGYLSYVQLAHSRYVGAWAFNQKHGFGTETSGSAGASCRVYEGNFRANQRHGFGTLRKLLPNGDYATVYVGGWRAGRRHGDGKRFYANGSVYWGDWADGVRCGRGFLWLTDGSTYVGEWKDDRYDGAGVLFQVNGNRYEGMFRGGRKHGEGTFYHLHTGQVQKGMWSEGQCVASIMQDELRQTALRPTPYPMPRNHLQSGDDVLRKEMRLFMDDLPVIKSKIN